jgi:hypothetical protein
MYFTDLLLIIICIQEHAMHMVKVFSTKKTQILSRCQRGVILVRIGAPDPVGSAFNFGLDPDPDSGSRCLKIGLKSQTLL